jgi:transcriptional regulator of acetoin/glycerol metabolism
MRRRADPAAVLPGTVRAPVSGGVAEAIGRSPRDLTEHPWPGNVREVKNVVERLVIRNKSGEIQRDDLPLEVLRAAPAVQVVAAPPTRPAADVLFERMVHGGESFWSCVYAPFMSRDLTRDDLRAIVRKGLERTSGNYKVMVELFNMPADDYKRFLGFLRKYQCHMPFQQFRSAAISREAAKSASDKPLPPGRIAASA